MAKYRKKPVVIEAVQFDGTHEGGSAIIGWMKTYGTVGGAIGEAILSIATLEGTMTASPGDWIIKGVQGEFYPCKPEIFEATYEPEEGAALATAQPEVADPPPVAVTWLMDSAYLDGFHHHRLSINTLRARDAVFALIPKNAPEAPASVAGSPESGGQDANPAEPANSAFTAGDADAVRQPATFTTAQPEDKGEGVDARIAAAREYDNPTMPDTERKLRRLLAVAYAGVSLYMDDGELSDGRERPVIDFLRYTPEQIAAAMRERATRQWQGQRAYEPPVSGHDPADVSTESANVDMRQAQGGGEGSDGV